MGMEGGPLEMRCCCACPVPLARLVITDVTSGEGLGEAGLDSEEIGYPGHQGRAVRRESGKKLGAGVGQEAWGPSPGPLHTQLGLVPVAEWEVIEAQALLHCQCKEGGEGRGEAGVQDP